MKIIILGAGQVGGTLAENLSGERNDITVVDRDSAPLADLADRLDISTVQGHGSFPAVLNQAGAEDAVERVRTYAPAADLLDVGDAAFEIYEDAGEEWRWRLRHRNGNVLADSGEGYSGRSEATAAVTRLKRHAPNADEEATEA